jgi:eukaryotic-like serine/threonine-protein kinase
MSTEPRRLGKYELRERLASGGQGEVWKAFDPQLRRYVAIKLLHHDLQADPDFSSRFVREAQFIASLHHPNIVQIHDFQLVHTPDPDTSIAYMVMDYIEGPTLADYIRGTSRRAQFPDAADIVYIFTAVSLAIDYAHGKGMIHRDIKPANIMLDQRSRRRNPIGEPILTDFGIAKLQGVTADTTIVLGTPLYVSPEQAQYHTVDKRSDLYSLGIILYEMTTGVTPFRGDSLMAILMQHYQEIPTPPSLINPYIPPALSEVILKSIAKDPDARFPSASAMTIAVAGSLNVPVPAELLKPAARPDTSKLSNYNPLRPSQPLGITPAPLTSFSSQFSPPPIVSSPSVFTPPANDGYIASLGPADGRPGSVLFPNSGTNTPVGVIPQPSPLSPPASRPPAAPQPPSRQKRPLYIAVIALLVAIVAGSGLYVFFTRPTTPPSTANPVVGQVHFLSSQASPGNIDEAQITIQQINVPPAGEQYYAWLQIKAESTPLIRWPLTTKNGSMSDTYLNANLLTNKPYLLLITVEKAETGPIIPSSGPGVRRYYANLPNNIKNMATFDIRPCPQNGTAGICMS